MFIYIDTENVQPSAWASNLHKLSKTDRVYLIYTKNSNKIPYEFIHRIHTCKATIETVLADSGTANALDFVLVSLMSRKSVTASKTTHVIISNDKGYYAAMAYLESQGAITRRYNSISEAIRIERG